MKKFLAAAAIGMAALALHPGPVRADTSAGTSEAAKGAALVRDVNELPSSHGAAGGSPETPRFDLTSATHRPVTAAAHQTASGFAILMWAAVTAGLVTTRTGRNRRWRRTRRRPLSDDELRELLGIRPGPRPAT